MSSVDIVNTPAAVSDKTLVHYIFKDEFFLFIAFPPQLYLVSN